MSLLSPLVLRRPWRAALSAVLLGAVDLLLAGLLITASSFVSALFLAAALAVMLYGTGKAPNPRYSGECTSNCTSAL